MGLLAHADEVHPEQAVALMFGLDAIEREIARLEKWLEEAPQRRHEEWLRDFENRCEIAKQSVIFEIRKMFADAFPNRYYVFLVKRPRDTEPWPVVFTDRARANSYEDRFGPVVEVLL